MAKKTLASMLLKQGREGNTEKKKIKALWKLFVLHASATTNSGWKVESSLTMELKIGLTLSCFNEKI